MGWFDWLFGRKRPAVAAVPSWASFFTRAELDAFHAAVLAELAALGLAVELRDGTVDVRRAPGTEPQALGLQNLAQRCRGLPQAEWAQEVRQHFGQVLSAEAEAREVLAKVRDFEAIRGLLKVNVYGQPLPRGQHAEVFTWEIADGLVGCLVYDLPSTTRSVPVDDTQVWGKSRDELIRLAVSNATSEQVQEERLDVQEGCTLTVLGGGFFTSSNALNLERRVPVEHPWGALVSVPNRHTVVYHLITSIKVITAVNTMLLLAHRMFVDGPGSITPELYWWRQGRLERLPARVDKDQALHFAPPEEFVQMLNQLAQPN